jgi:hypothetical protein
MDDAMGKRIRLAGACPRDDKKRAIGASVRCTDPVFDGTTLAAVELLKIGRKHRTNRLEMLQLETMLASGPQQASRRLAPARRPWPLCRPNETRAYSPKTYRTVAFDCSRNSGVRLMLESELLICPDGRTQHTPEAMAMYCLPFTA